MQGLISPFLACYWTHIGPERVHAVLTGSRPDRRATTGPGWAQGKHVGHYKGDKGPWKSNGTHPVPDLLLDLTGPCQA